MSFDWDAATSAVKQWEETKTSPTAGRPAPAAAPAAPVSSAPASTGDYLSALTGAPAAAAPARAPAGAGVPGLY